MFDGYSEASFVFSSVCEFVKAWDSGSDSKLVLESRKGHVQMSFTCELGKPNDNHFDPSKLFKKTKQSKTKSNKKRERDNLRAKLYQQRLSQTKDSGAESAAAPASEDTSAVVTTEPSDNTEDVETSDVVTVDDNINLPSRAKAVSQELNKITETSENKNEVAAEPIIDYLPRTQILSRTWAESWDDKTAVTRETVLSRDEFFVVEEDGRKTFQLWENPCWNHSTYYKWCSSDCASPLKDRHVSDQRKCDCGGITAADVMSKDGWQYDHGYCGRATCLRGDKLFMCWRARLTVALDEDEEDDTDDDTDEEVS